MARHASERRGPRWLRTIFIGLAAVCGLGAAAIIIPPMMFETDVDVALIKAEQGPFKVKPKDPGGATIPHQETTVMSMIGGLVEQPEDVEILRPPSAVPEMPPTKAEDKPASAVAEPVAPQSSGQDEGTQTQLAETEADPQMPAAPDPQPETGVDTDKTVNEAAPTVAGSDNQTETETAVAIARPTSKPKPPKRVRVEGDDPL